SPPTNASGSSRLMDRKAGQGPIDLGRGKSTGGAPPALTIKPDGGGIALAPAVGDVKFSKPPTGSSDKPPPGISLPKQDNNPLSRPGGNKDSGLTPAISPGSSDKFSKPPTGGSDKPPPGISLPKPDSGKTTIVLPAT